MPATSSGEVSSRTRMTASLRRACRSASSALNTTIAARRAGLTAGSLGETFFAAFGSMVGCSSWSSDAGSTRRIALFRGR